MALIKCSECNREISDSAESCPGCGFKNISEHEFPDFAIKYPHPGPLPEITAITFQNKFAQIGNLAGRSLKEITSVVGPPNSITPVNPGITSYQWIRTSAWTGGFHIQLIFDKNGICGGVAHQFSTR